MGHQYPRTRQQEQAEHEEWAERLRRANTFKDLDALLHPANPQGAPDQQKVDA